jgi:hypothetical protein
MMISILPFIVEMKVVLKEIEITTIWVLEEEIETEDIEGISEEGEEAEEIEAIEAEETEVIEGEEEEEEGGEGIEEKMEISEEKEVLIRMILILLTKALV